MVDQVWAQQAPGPAPVQWMQTTAQQQQAQGGGMAMGSNAQQCLHAVYREMGLKQNNQSP